MLNVGFDPVFIDVLTKILDKSGSLSDTLPGIGDHHPWSSIQLVPGGNGFNFARALHRKKENVIFWGKIDPVYEALLKISEPKMKTGTLGEQKKDFTSNITVALETTKGELQINYVNNFVAPNDLQKNAIDALEKTKIVSFLNIGLNREWNELFYFMSNIIKNNNKLEVALFDPSTLKDFSQWEELKKWYEESFKNINANKIISVNEFEAEKLISKYSLEFFIEIASFFIVHTAEKVSIYSSQKRDTVMVPVLKNEPLTHVGIGDTFNAGLVYALLRGEDIVKAVKFGIQYAQELMMRGWDRLGKE